MTSRPYASLAHGVAILAIACLAASPAAAWNHDEDRNKIDDRIEAVGSLGFAAAFEDRDLSKRMTIAVFGSASSPTEALEYGVYIGYAHRPADADVEDLRKLGISIIRPYLYIDYIRAQASAEQIASITSFPGVSRVEAIPMRYAINHFGSRVVRSRDSRGLMKAQNEVLFPSVRQQYGLDGRGIVIGILDTGINDAPDPANPGYLGHESVAGKFLGGGNFYSGQPALNTQPAQSINPDDHGSEVSSYHASHVAGTALGTGGQDGFFAGVAPAARFVDCKVLSDAGAGFGSLDGIEWCIFNRNNSWGLAGADTIYAGIDIISMSLGCIGCSSDGTDAEEQLINTATTDYGLIFCIATGNDDSQNLITSPAGADLCISVGATLHGGTLDRSNDLVTTFSNEGTRADDGDTDHFDEMKPSIVAPGENIVSANGDPTTDGGGYKSLSGTSMSTPCVAGVCALIRQVNPSLTALEIREILENTAEHNILTAKAGGDRANDPYGLDPNYDPGCGWGLVDTYAAVKEALNSTSGVQVVQIRSVARPDDGEIDVRWVTQREYAFQGFNVHRAVDVSGAPGAFAQVNGVLVAPSPDGDPNIEGDDNRTPYLFVDGDPGLVLGTTYWYRIDWVALNNTPNSEPPVPVTFGEQPRIATAYYRIAHNSPDEDLTVTIGTSTTYDALAAEFVTLSPSKVADQDSSVEIVPTNAATAAIGSIEHWWSLGISEDDGVGAYLPPRLQPEAHPWFLNVFEGHFVNRAGRITSFTMFVNDSPGSSSGTTYTTSTVLPAQTVEGQATAAWIPDRTTSVPSARLSASRDEGGVRIGLELGDRGPGASVVVSRGTTSNFQARVPLTPSPIPVAEAQFEYLDVSAEPGVTYWYWVESTDRMGQQLISGPVTAEALGRGSAPTSVTIAGPNPIRDASRIDYTVGSDVAGAGAVPVGLTIHDVQGRLVRRLTDAAQPAGAYRVEWDGKDESSRSVAGGIYFLRFQAGVTTRTAKISVVR